MSLWLIRIFGMVVSLVWLATPMALAHNSPSSAVLLDFHRDGVMAELILPLEELQFSFQQPLLAETNSILSKHAQICKT